MILRRMVLRWSCCCSLRPDKGHRENNYKKQEAGDAETLHKTPQGNFATL